jgi:hypothetical protein
MFRLPLLHHLSLQQDTVKQQEKNFSTPAGRAIDFYDFSSPTEELPPVQKEKPAADKDLKKAEKPVAAKPKEKKTVALPEKKEASQNTEKKEVKPEAETVLNPIPSHLKFYRDSSQKRFDPVQSFNEYHKTFIVEEAVLPGAPFGTSIFTGHDLTVKNLEPIPFKKNNTDGMLAVILFILLLLAFIKNIYYKRLTQYLKAFFTQRITSQMMREEKSFSEQYFLLLFIVSLLITSLFIYQLSDHFKFLFYNNGPGTGLLQTFLLIAAIVLTKIIIIRFSGYIFNLPKLSNGYVFISLLYFNMFNLFLFPLSICIQYLTCFPKDFFIIGGLVSFLLLMVFYFFRLFQTGNSEPGTSSVYLFLYLCTLEILPLLFVIKYISDNTHLNIIG